MASVDDRVLSYHVVPHFAIPAKNGPLSLGTIVSNLRHLAPLNRGPFLVNPDGLTYDPVVQTDFKDTLARVRKLNTSAWLKALGLPFGASANIGASDDIEDSVSCDSIITTYFDPDPSGVYAKKCFAVKPVKDALDAGKDEWFDSFRVRSIVLYLVTGLKVARNLKFNNSGTQERHMGGSAEGSEPHTNAVEGGVKADASEEKKHNLQFTVDDIIIGFRVNKYRVRRIFGMNGRLKERGVLDGDMQDDQESQSAEPDFEVELIPDESEDRTANDGTGEVWVA
ncbi:hypothetical protein F66182_6005 [Fusarium sp. NRRL 66182]|nr:hypothetical protein F66182_6005 [Fusarium sp. NRRL 66182]